MKKGKIITIGNFDGLHVGHRKILLTAIKKAKIENRETVAITFWPHPQTFFGKKLKLIQPLNERISLIKKVGISEVDVLPFKEIVDFSPEEFLLFLTKRHKIKAIIVGEEFRFGKNRKGDIRYLKSFGKNLNIYVKGVKVINFMNEKVSSSLIRKYLQEGNLQRARIMLGGFYSIKGKVIRGDRRGKIIKFPTANIKYPEDFLLPDGVYITKTCINNKYYNSLTHVGPNLTFGGKEKKIETHIINFTGNIYEYPIEIFFIDYIREIKRFPDKQKLYEAISSDLNYSLSLLQL